MAGKVVNSSLVLLSKFGASRQECASKTATSHIQNVGCNSIKRQTLQKNNMKKTQLLLLLILFAFNSFGQNFSTKKGGHIYQLDIPDYFTRCFDLNDVATMEYKNIVKETYLVVIDEEKEEINSVGMQFVSSTDFLKYFVKDYFLDAKNRHVSETKEFKNNENSFSQVEFSFSNEDGEYFMLITAVETKTHFYKILIWTLLGNKDQYIEDFGKIAGSLKD